MIKKKVVMFSAMFSGVNLSKHKKVHLRARQVRYADVTVEGMMAKMA